MLGLAEIIFHLVTELPKQRLLGLPECRLKQSGSLGASVFPETMSIRLLLCFENEKDCKRMRLTLPEKPATPELEEGQGIPFWNRGARIGK